MASDLPADEHLFDPRLLRDADVPGDLPLSGGRVVLLWQRPSEATLARLLRRYPSTPVLAARFDAETPLFEAGCRYWTPGDFFPLPALLRLNEAGLEARLNWRGPAEPAYRGMSLIDGDLARYGVWKEMVATAGMLMLLRQTAPQVEVLTDWMGAPLAQAAGLRVRRLWRADWADANWPVRRRWRERMVNARKWISNGGCGSPAASALETNDPADTEVVFLLGGWVEPRLLESFPIEAMSRAGHRCVLWVHRRSTALDELVTRTGVECQALPFPEPAQDAAGLQSEVEQWCAKAAEDGFFAPLRGRLARAAVERMAWGRWAPKLVAMYRLIEQRLMHIRPKLLIAPAEKDWSAYCGHHAARALGIPTVGIKHGIWLPGSDLHRQDHRNFLPLTADVVPGYTPRDAEAWSQVATVRPGQTPWWGNPRLDKEAPDGDGEPAAKPERWVLVATRGVGPGDPIGLRQSVIPYNIRLVQKLHSQLGDRMRVRLHPWDSPLNYPEAVRAVMLPHGRPLEDDLQAACTVVTTYSAVVLDAAAAGLPIFIWDHAGLAMATSEVVQEAGAAVYADLDELGAAVAGQVAQQAYGSSSSFDPEAYRAYLRQHLEPHETPEAALVRALESIMEGRRARAAVQADA